MESDGKVRIRASRLVPLRYALAGAALATCVPAGLPVIRALERGAPWSWRLLEEDVASQPWTYAYVALATMSLMGALGWLLGGWSARAHRLSITDPLTGLYNRRHFGRQLAAEIMRDRHAGAATCVMCVDLDRLKTINDQLGHDRGDAVLVHVASVLSRRLRARDVVARFGGDEFAVLLPNTSGGDAIAIAERVVAELALPVSGLPQRLSVSIGIAELDRITSANDLLLAADRALYCVKSTGGGRVMLAPPEPPAPGDHRGSAAGTA